MRSIVSPVVGVRLVPLEHRELGLVLVRDALVAEVLADLVDALEAADDEALEVELGRDAQVEVGVELVRVRDERVRERAAVPRLQDRRLDLDEAVLVQVAADRGDDPRAQEEELARVLVHQQVEVALPVARLRVGEPVERVREAGSGSSRAPQLVDRERRLAAARARRRCPRRRRRRRGPRRPHRPGSSSHRSWMRPERSTRSRKTSFPCRAAPSRARRAGASRSTRCPGRAPAASARTAAISSRSGKRFGAAMPAESRAAARWRLTRP